MSLGIFYRHQNLFMCLHGMGVARRQGEEEIHWVWEGTRGWDESGANGQIHT